MMSTAEPSAPPSRRISRKHLLIAGISIFLLLCGYCGYELDFIIHLGRQTKTTGDIRMIADGLDEFRAHNGHYPETDSIEGLMAVLVPVYLRKPLTLDGWHNKLHYEAFAGNPGHCLINTAQQPLSCGPAHFILASPGFGGIFEQQRLQDSLSHETHQIQCDIIFRDDQFITWPNGKQEFGKCMNP